MKFKVGDRVAVYQYNLAYYHHTEKGTIVELVGKSAFKVELDKYPNTYNNIVVHHKQCRRLVKKKNNPWRKKDNSYYDSKLIDMEFDFKERLYNLEKWIYQELQDLHKRIMDDPTKHNK